MIIDPKSATPIYRQIVEQTREAVDAGVYRSGEALPSLRALAVEIRVNPNTVQRAYEELERLGVIESRRGLGVFVRATKGKTARVRADKEVAASFRTGIEDAIRHDLTPARIRELFAEEMEQVLSKARKR